MSEQLDKIKMVGMMALDGKNDNEIGQELNIEPMKVCFMRKGLGIYASKGKRTNVMTMWKKAYSYASSALTSVNFSLNDTELKSLGLDLDGRKTIRYTGKIVGKELVLSFKN